MSDCCSRPPQKETPPPPLQCACRKAPSATPENDNRRTVRYALLGLSALFIWLAAYSAILPLAQWIAYDLLSLSRASEAGAAVEFFLYDTAKILLLLVLMVYAIGWLRAGMHVEKVRAYLAGKGRGIGYLMGSGFGAITPFCSCSSIPLFLGFTTAGIPVGITMSFLITSPLINEIAVVLLWGLLGWKFTLIYIGVGLAAGIAGGMFMDAIHAERWLQPFLLDARKKNPGRPLFPGQTPRIGLRERHAFAYAETAGIFRRVWLWVLFGVAIGAFLHGFVPQEWFTEHLGAGQWWSVPVAVAIGIPLYTNVTGIIPIMESLLLKGLPLGTTLAFCMSTVAASLPEVLMLKQVMRWQLLAVFIAMLLVVFTLAGWLFNLLQAYLV